MNEYKIIILRERPELAPIAAEWFHCKWGVPTEAYLECMEAYLSGKTESSKNKKAQSLGIPIISETQFLEQFS